MKTLILVALAGAFVAFFMFGGKSDTDSDQAHALVKNGAVLIDVRTTAEFSAGHIPGAKNIPVQNLASRLSELPEKDKEIVLYCRSGSRSGRAQRMLASKGWTKVYNLGPMTRW